VSGSRRLPGCPRLFRFADRSVALLPPKTDEDDEDPRGPVVFVLCTAA
jgi:hypothetical protein